MAASGGSTSELTPSISAAGELVIDPCEHASKGANVRALERKDKLDLRTCRECSATTKSGLWLCLLCAHVGCSRDRNKHAEIHYQQERHPLVMKLNDEKFPVWCYACDDFVSETKSGDDRLHQIALCRRHVKTVVNRLPRGSGGAGHSPNVARRGLSTSSPVAKPIVLQNAPTFRPGQAGVKGLFNLGNTCFFNSIMQNFTQTALLRDYYSAYTRETAKPPKSEGPMTSALREFLRTMWVNADSPTVNPKGLFSEIAKRATRFRGYHQQDAHELLRALLDGVRDEEIKRLRKGQKSVKRTKKNAGPEDETLTFVDDIFGGVVSSTVICSGCNTASSRYERCLDISLPLPSEKVPKKKLGKKSPKPALKKRRPTNLSEMGPSALTESSSSSSNPPAASTSRQRASGSGGSGSESSVSLQSSSLATLSDSEPPRPAVISRGTSVRKQNSPSASLRRTISARGSGAAGDKGSSALANGKTGSPKPSPRVPAAEAAAATNGEKGSRATPKLSVRENGSGKGTPTLGTRGTPKLGNKEPASEGKDKEKDKEKDKKGKEKEKEKDSSGDVDKEKEKLKKKPKGSPFMCGRGMVSDKEDDEEKDDSKKDAAKKIDLSNLSTESGSGTGYSEHDPVVRTSGASKATKGSRGSKGKASMANGVAAGKGSKSSKGSKKGSKGSGRGLDMAHTNGTRGVKRSGSRSGSVTGSRRGRGSPSPEDEGSSSSGAASSSRLISTDTEKSDSSSSEEVAVDQGPLTVERCLQEYCKVEHLVGKNKFGCEICTKRKKKEAPEPAETEETAPAPPPKRFGRKKGSQSRPKEKPLEKHDATIQCSIRTAPATLTLHLKRFTQSGGGLRKLGRPVQFPLELDLTPYLDTRVAAVSPGSGVASDEALTASRDATQDGASGDAMKGTTHVSKSMPRTLREAPLSKTARYRLYGVCTHAGSLNGGHYTAYVQWQGDPARFSEEEGSASDDGSGSDEYSDTAGKSNGGGAAASGTSAGSKRSSRGKGKGSKASKGKGKPKVAPTRLKGDEWFYFSDTHCSRVTVDRVLAAEAYLLFYARIDDDGERRRVDRRGYDTDSEAGPGGVTSSSSLLG